MQTSSEHSPHLQGTEITVAQKSVSMFACFHVISLLWARVWQYYRAVGTCLNALYAGLNLRYAACESDVMEQRYGYSSLVSH